jgi:4a-hydroxytetrahydrobiopterin dehydratase
MGRWVQDLIIMEKYSLDEIQDKLSSLPGWTIVDEAIEKKFEFRDFKEALGFIVQVGILAEQADHHPELLNIYNKVTIRLNTHSANSITSKDFDLAEKIDRVI